MDSREGVKERRTFRFWVVTAAVLGIALYGVMFRASDPVSVLPYLLLPAACLLMHFFMHGQHGAHDAHTPGERVVSSPATGNLGAPVDQWRTPVDVREEARREHVEVRIDGLSCASDAIGLEHLLTHHAGVIEAMVNPVTEIAYVTFDPAVTGLSALRQRIEKAGFGAMERTSTATASRDHVLRDV